MTISAVIFDLDGTVLDNEDEYGLAFKKVLARLGRKVNKKYPHITGIGVKENWPILLSRYHIKTERSLEDLTQATQDIYLSLLPRVTLKKGFVQYVQDLKDSGIKIALATSNVWWILDEVAGEFKLDNFFNVITTGEEVEYKKPDPDLFKVTAQKLGVEPDECLVIEDSVAGVEAAHRAGMKAVAITRDEKHRKSLKDADLVISDYFDLTPQKVMAL